MLQMLMILLQIMKFLDKFYIKRRTNAITCRTLTATPAQLDAMSLRPGPNSLQVRVFLHTNYLMTHRLALKGQFSIGTSMSQFDNPCVVINLHLVLLL